MRTKAAAWIVVGLLAAAVPVAAHHSVAPYDMDHPVTIKGVVKRLEWTNPHAYIYVDVKNDRGETEEWAVEIDSPNFLKHNGWTRDTVKAGDMITCTGGRAKTGATTMRCTTVDLLNGQKLRS